MAKDFLIEEEYFNFILEEMQKKGWITGLQFVSAWEGDLVRFTGFSRVKITGDGIQYLSAHPTMRKALE